MKRIAMAVGLLSVLIISSNIHAFGGCEEDCQKCHTLEKKEAQEILNKMKATDARVLGVRMSPIRGLWEVTVEDSKGGRGVVYVGFSKKYVMGGTIYEVDTSANKTKEALNKRQAPPDRYVDPAGIPLDQALLLGDRDAKIKVIVFTDPDCPYCAQLHGELKKILSQRNDIAFYLILMPLKIHPDAYWKAESIMCAKSVALLEENFEKKPIPRPDCNTETVEQNIGIGRNLGITGTPTLVMPDGFVLVGGENAALLTDLILEHRRKG